MRKKIIFTITLITAASVMLFGFGCAKQPKTAEQTLEDIMSKASRLNEFSYDVITTDPQGNQMTVAIYMKGTKMRQESEIQGQKVIMLGDFQGVMYTYTPSQNTAIKMDLTTEAGELEESPYETVQDIMDTATIIGYETIDGKKCVVVEYKLMKTEFTQKMWVWEKYGIPIRVETTTSEGTTTIEYKNIKTGGVSDDLFELPAGVNVIDLEAIMQGNIDPETLKMLQGFGQ